MANPTPTDFLPGYIYMAGTETLTEAGIFIPLADIAGLTATEADEATGNGSEVIHKLLATITENYATLDPKPTKFAVLTSENPANDTQVRVTYDVSFICTVPKTAYEVVSE